MDGVPTGFQLLLKSGRKLSPNSQLVIRIIKELPKAMPVRSLRRSNENLALTWAPHAALPATSLTMFPAPLLPRC